MDNSRTGKVCLKTIGLKYPHHWNCKYVETGHPGCSCEGKDSCKAGECIINQGPNSPDRRFPDGSICAKEEIEDDYLVFGISHISGKRSLAKIKLGTSSNT